MALVVRILINLLPPPALGLQVLTIPKRTNQAILVILFLVPNADEHLPEIEWTDMKEYVIIQSKGKCSIQVSIEQKALKQLGSTDLEDQVVNRWLNRNLIGGKNTVRRILVTFSAYFLSSKRFLKLAKLTLLHVVHSR